jgi:hypothetical protein
MKQYKPGEPFETPEEVARHMHSSAPWYWGMDGRWYGPRWGSTEITMRDGECHYAPAIPVDVVATTETDEEGNAVEGLAPVEPAADTLLPELPYNYRLTDAGCVEIWNGAWLYYGGELSIPAQFAKHCRAKHAEAVKLLAERDMWKEYRRGLERKLRAIVKERDEFEQQVLALSREKETIRRGLELNLEAVIEDRNRLLADRDAIKRDIEGMGRAGLEMRCVQVEADLTTATALLVRMRDNLTFNDRFPLLLSAIKGFLGRTPKREE